MKVVRQQVNILGEYSSIKPDDLMARVAAELKNHKTALLHTVRLEIEKFYEPYDQDPSYHLILSFDRSETPAETEEREQAERLAVEKRQAQERAEYERLKKKFE